MMCKKGVSLREIKYSLGGRGEKRLLVVRVSVKFLNMCSVSRKKTGVCNLFPVYFLTFFYLFITCLLYLF